MEIFRYHTTFPCRRLTPLPPSAANKSSEWQRSTQSVRRPGSALNNGANSFSATFRTEDEVFALFQPFEHAFAAEHPQQDRAIRSVKNFFTLLISRPMKSFSMLFTQHAITLLLIGLFAACFMHFNARRLLQFRLRVEKFTSKCSAPTHPNANRMTMMIYENIILILWT